MRASINISLPDSLRDWVERQVEEKGYGTASEYVGDVLRREQEAAARMRVDARLTEAINSGDSMPMTRQDWQRIRREGLKRARRQQKK
jgi:antitoxin ParD1/3/4